MMLNRTLAPTESPFATQAVAIVVPVNNEERLLPSAIAGLHVAVSYARQVRPGLKVAVRFALDRCTDASQTIIEAAGFRWIAARRPGVGAARSAGVSAALAELSAYPDHRVLVASTDADSVVPADWITHQVELAEGGADVIVGAVKPRADDLDWERRTAWELTHRDSQSLGHIHGANLGLRANFYLAAGGFAPLQEHEDVDLVARAARIGARVRPTEVHCVITSGRLEGRTAGGYAGYLRDELLALAHASSTGQSATRPSATGRTAADPSASDRPVPQRSAA